MWNQNLSFLRGKKERKKESMWHFLSSECQHQDSTVYIIYSLVLLVTNVDCTVTGIWILVNQITLTQPSSGCTKLPRKDPDYAPLTKVGKNAPKSPQNIILPYHQLKEATLSMMYARAGIKNWWFYQLVLGILCSLKTCLTSS